MKNLAWSLLFLGIVAYGGIRVDAAEIDRDLEVIDTPLFLVPFEESMREGFSLDGIQLIFITDLSLGNLSLPQTSNFYTTLTSMLRKGGVVFLSGKTYSIAIRLAADCGERLVFYCDETLSATADEAKFHLNPPLDSATGTGSLMYPYLPSDKDCGPPLKETGNATVWISADLSVSEGEVKTFPVAVSFHYGLGQVFYTSFHLQKNAESQEVQNLAKAITSLAQNASKNREKPDP